MAVTDIPAYDLRVHHTFALLPLDQQIGAIQRLAATGAGDHAIASATGLSVEMVRRLLGTRETPQ